MAVDPARAARERKQKIFVVVGGVVLLGLLAFQLPKLLGGSETPTAAPTPADTTIVGEPAPTTTPSQTVVLGDTDRPHPPDPGKLRSFSIFDPKDPFEQQVDSTPQPETQAPSGGVGVSQGAGSGGQPPTKGFNPNQTPAATMTVISVNGARQPLTPGSAFPSANPVFVLVAEQPKAKSVVIGIAGGAYSSGAKTTKLRVGKPLVLVNTTTRARYRLVLVAVGSGDAAGATTPSP
jgi:hypothetical protein